MRAFLLAFLLLLTAGFAQAETISATQGRYARCNVYGVWGPTLYFSLDSSITTTYPLACAAAGGFFVANTCFSNQDYSASAYCTNGFVDNVCPANQNWTLSGTNCTRPDCAAGEMRDSATGLCVPSCATRSGTQQSAGYYDIGTSATGSPTTYGCSGGCSVIFSGTTPAGTSVVGGTRHYYAQGSYTYTSDTCSSGTAPGAATSSMPADSCGSNQTKGTINGQTVCVDNATKTPVSTGTNPVTNNTRTTSTTDPTTGTTTSKTTSTASDGSTAITTTTCSGAGSCTSVTQIIPGASGGTGASQLVPKADTPTDYQRDSTGATTNTRLAEIKEILNPTGAAPDTSLSTQSTAFADAETAIDNGIKAVGDRAQSNMGGLLSWSWTPDIPTGTCSAFTMNFSGRTVVLDWCEKIESIKSFSAYALYILTAWALFGIATARREVA